MPIAYLDVPEGIQTGEKKKMLKGIYDALNGAYPFPLDSDSPKEIGTTISGVIPEALLTRRASAEWSVHENLAHLARHHKVFLERLQRILNENTPELDRYRAEDDSAWPEWSDLPTEEVLNR